MTRQTPLFPAHIALNGLMVDFAGWRMPLHYGSQINEHHAVRQRAGMFDVSHMCVIEVKGAQSQSFMRFALSNDVKKLDKNGKALYSCMLNSQGGVIDDLIVYRLSEEHYRLVVNASRRAADFEWLTSLSTPYSVQLQEREDLALIAIQGPQAIAAVSSVLSSQLSAQVRALKPFYCCVDGGWQIARTGYTGEEGLEVILPVGEALPFWNKLLAASVQPCGLGARDTLRLEAGLNLYGADMDETTTPLESHLEFTVDGQDATRNFMGREALEKQKQQGITRHLVGLVMEAGGVLRNHQSVWVAGALAGEITSGGFSPTLNCAIAMARIAVNATGEVEVERRGKRIPVRRVKLPFVRKGSALV